MTEQTFDEFVQEVTDDYQITAIENSVDELLFVDWLEQCYIRKLPIASTRKFLEDKARTQFVSWK